MGPSLGSSCSAAFTQVTLIGYVSDLEDKVLGMPPHAQIRVPGLRSPRQQCDPPPSTPRALCGL